MSLGKVLKIQKLKLGPMDHSFFLLSRDPDVELRTLAQYHVCLHGAMIFAMLKMGKSQNYNPILIKTFLYNSFHGYGVS